MSDPSGNTDSPSAGSAYEIDEQRWSAMMQRVQKGDEATYRQLLEELSQVIQRYLVSRFGPQDFIEDCVQETLLAIHHGRHTYQPGRLFRPWLFAIVRNKSIDALRKRKSYQRMVESEAQQQQVDSANATPGDIDVDYRLTQAQLLQSLAPQFREAIVLTKLVGYSNAEAARKMQISETAVKVRVHRGIARLRQLLEADES